VAGRGAGSLLDDAAPPRAPRPEWETLRPGERLNLGAYGLFTVAERRSATYASAEGDLPFVAAPGAEFRYADISGADGSLGRSLRRRSRPRRLLRRTARWSSPTSESKGSPRGRSGRPARKRRRSTARAAAEPCRSRTRPRPSGSPAAIAGHCLVPRCASPGEIEGPRRSSSTGEALGRALQAAAPARGGRDAWTDTAYVVPRRRREEDDFRRHGNLLLRPEYLLKETKSEA